MSSYKDTLAQLQKKYGVSAQSDPVKPAQTGGAEDYRSVLAQLQNKYGTYGQSEPVKTEDLSMPVKQIRKSPAAAQPVITGAKEGIRGQQDTRERSYAEKGGITKPLGIQYGAAASAPNAEKPGAAEKVGAKEAVGNAVSGFGREQKPVTEADAIRQMARDSERAYYDYIHSAEYRAAVEAQRQKALESGRSGGYAASSGMFQGAAGAQGISYPASAGIAKTDEEEAARNEIIDRAALLKNEADYWQDELTKTQDLASYEGWSDEDKALLQRYITGRLGSDETLFTDIWQLSPMGGLPGALFRGGQLISAEDAARELAKKYGRETVENMAETVKRQQNAQRAEEVRAGAQRHSEGLAGGTIASVGAIGASTMGSITGTAGVVGDLLTRTGRYKTLDPNQAGNLPNVYAGAVKENVTRQIAGEGEESNIFRKGAALLYQGGMSAVENIARVAAGGQYGSLAMAASGSFASTVASASEQGATPEQALALGIINAGVEAATEKIPLDELFKAAKAGDPIKALKQILKQGGIEAVEEEISLLATTFAEAAILREKSGYNRMIREQMAQGKSYKEAKHFADMQILKEAGETAAVSFISGGLMEGANELVNYTGTKQGQQGAESPQAAETGIGKAASEKQEAPAKAGEQATGGDTGDTATQIAAPAQPVQAAVDEFRKTGTVSNRAATAILSDPQAVEQLAKETGITLPETNSGKRKAVKDAVEKLSNSTGRVTPESLAEYLVSANREEAQDKPLTPEQTAAGMRETFRQAMGTKEVDTQPKGQYNEDTINGGTEYAENREQGLSGAHEAGLPGGAGAGQNGGHDPAGLRVHGRAPGDVGTGSQMVPGDVPGRSGTGDPEVRVRASGILRVSTQLRNARDNRGVRSYDLYDTSTSPQEYEQALTAGRNSDPVNGWCVTPKSAQEMAEGNVRTMMNADGTVGVGIAPDGDIVAVFKNKNGGPRGALDTAMPMAIEMGGDRLDCYGKGLVKVYENYGFIPVARVEFNPEYANEGWTPDKGTPYIYVMMHNGDSAAGVTEKMHTYRHATAAELDALPTYGKDGYDDAMAYRDNMLRERGQNVDNKLYNAAGMDHGSVGADTTKFKHETRRSKVYDNTYRNATDEDIRKAGQTAEELDPRIAEYEYISEKESLSNAQMRTRDQENINAEYEDLIGKEAWTGEDNDTAMIILKQFQKDGDVDRFRRLAKAQRQKGTTGGQLIQSFAKYSRDATKAAVDAVDALDNLSMADVPKRFFAKYGKNADGLEAWKKDMTASVLDIANEIEGIGENDADAMRDMIRQLANFRKTTAWFGYSSNLTKNAERILKKLDFGTAKDMAAAQLAKIPDDFRKRSTGEVIKTIRFQNMLSSLLSVNRNLLGNATTGMIDAFSDSTGGRLADMLMAKATGKRTIGNDLRYGKEYLKAALDAGDMAALCAELDIPTNSESRYLTGRTRTFSPQSNVMGRFFSAYEKYLNYGLGVTDEFFAGGTEGAVSKSLEALGKKSGLTDKEIAELGQKAGRRRTYKEGRRIAKASSTIKQGLNYIGTDGIGAGDLVLPFAEIPAEMGQVAIDYSGVGFVEGITEMIGVIRDAKAGKEIDPYRQRKAAADFGRGMTGPAIIAAFTALAAAGVIAVHDDDDWDKNALEQSMGLSGAQFNLDAALRLAKGESTQWQQDDLVVSIDFLQPFNSQMYIGYLLSREDTFGDMLKAAPGATLKGITQSVLDIPMMGTFEDIADIVSSLYQVTEGDFSPVEDAAGKLLGDIASGFIPAPVRQTGQFIDPVYRDTSGDNALEGAANRLKSMIPGLSQTLPAQYDGLGNEQRRFDNGLIGFFNTFINPGTLKTIDTNEVVEYLSKMDDASVYPDYRAPKSFQYKGETVMISGKEMTEKYQRTYGRNVANLYGALIDSKEFRALSEDQQAEALKKAENYATQIARASVYPKYEGAPSGSTKEMINEILLKVKAADFAGSEKVFGEMTGAGVSSKTAYDIGKLMDSLKPQEGYKTVRDIQQAEAIAGANLTERDTIAALKAYGSDAQDENLDAVMAEGYSADQYVEMWRMISNEKEKGGDGAKRRTIQLLANAYRISEEDATELYEIFYPKSK